MVSHAERRSHYTRLTDPMCATDSLPNSGETQDASHSVVHSIGVSGLSDPGVLDCGTWAVRLIDHWRHTTRLTSAEYVTECLLDSGEAHCAPHGEVHGAGVSGPTESGVSQCGVMVAPSRVTADNSAASSM